jgi:hypothetical protein
MHSCAWLVMGGNFALGGDPLLLHIDFTSVAAFGHHYRLDNHTVLRKTLSGMYSVLQLSSLSQQDAYG